MTAHPYPKKVVEAVAKALLKSSEGRGAFGAGGDWEAAGYVIRSEFMEHANTALTALWEASRVDTLSEVESLLPNTLLYTAKTQPRTFMMAGGVAMKQDPDLLPAHIIHWGGAR